MNLIFKVEATSTKRCEFDVAVSMCETDVVAASLQQCSQNNIHNIELNVDAEVWFQ